MKALVLGATGLTGKAFLMHAIAEPAISDVYTLSRREVNVTDAKLQSMVDPDTKNWAQMVPEVDMVLACLATTMGHAGGFANQYKIDHDLNVELAKAARAKGARIFVVVTALLANTSSFLPYYRMKGEIERDIVAVGFEKVIIFRPSVILGQREGKAKSAADAFFVSIGKVIYGTALAPLLATPIYGDTMGKVGLQLALHAPDGTHILEGKEIYQAGVAK